MPQVLTREIVILNASAFYQNPPRPQTKISTISASGRGLTQIYAVVCEKTSGQAPEDMRE
jgi:hypothetical protein